MNTELRQTLFMLIALAVTGLAVFGMGYALGSKAPALKLEELRGQVSRQSAQAKETLDQLTKERDEKQALLDAQAKQQEENDNAAKLEIARLADELASRPIRVRVIAASGACSGSAAGDTSTGTETGTGNDAATSGLLPEPNSRRLRAAIAEVETLSAAYSSCRKRLFSH
ncbi:putative outer membrane lytic protein [Bacillus phage vB_BspP_Dartukuta]|nr:putative outer membrane lytic protein [Bacillus phage vB_BspP_Dartukuta]